MLKLCLNYVNRVMVLALCLPFAGCRHSYDNAKPSSEITPDKNAAAQPIIDSSDGQGKSGMQPIAPKPAQTTTGMQPIAPHVGVESSPPAASGATTTTVTNTDGSTTTTITTPGETTTTTTTTPGETTTTTTTEVLPTDDPPSIAVARTATTEEAKSGGCAGAALVIDQGLDANRDGVLNPNEITQSSVSCQ